MPKKTSAETLFNLEAGFSFANFTLLSNVFIVGFALLLDASTFQIGILLGLPLFANLLQLFSPFILEKTGSRKWTALLTLFFGRVSIIFLVLMAFSLIPASINLFILVIALWSVTTAIGNLALLSWIKRVIAEKKLADFLSKRNIAASIAGIVVYVIGSYIIDIYSNFTTYAFLFSLSIVIGIIALFFLYSIKEKRKKIRAISFTRFTYLIKKPLVDQNFKPLTYFGFLWGFVINLAAVLIIVFLVEELALSFFLVSLFLVVDTIARVYGLRLWGKIVTTKGARPVLLIGSTVTAIVPFLLFFVTKENYWFVPVVLAFSAVSWAGVDVALGSILFRGAPRKEAPYYFSVYSSLNGVASGIGSIAGGFLATFLVPYMSYIPLIASPIKIVFLISFALRVLCIPLISKIHEPEVASVQDVITQLKSLKFASLFVRVYSFSEYTSRLVLFPQKQFFFLQRRASLHLQKDMQRLTELVEQLQHALFAAGNKTFLRLRLTFIEKALNSLIQKSPELIAAPFSKATQQLQEESKEFLDDFATMKKRELTKNLKELEETVEQYGEKVEEYSQEVTDVQDEQIKEMKEENN